MKIIFLDIDGVLNPLHYETALFKMWKSTNGQIKSKDQYGALFFDQNVSALHHLIEETDAKIVISSTWRMNGIEALCEMWDSRNLPGGIIGVTPILTQPDQFTRGAEIYSWLFEQARGEFEISNQHPYVIIDDNNDMKLSQQHRFVQTNSHVGLTMSDAEKAIKILLRK